MSRAKFDKAAGDAIAAAIGEIEAKTNAEIVVAVRGRSGTYRQADYLFGALIAFAGLLFVLFSPWDFHTYWIPFDVIALFIAGAFVSSRSDSIRRLLTTGTFRARAARAGAAAMFYEAGIANTSAENGLLIYLSLLEHHMEVIADRGILKAIPALKWNHAVFELKGVALDPGPASLIAALRELGAILAEHMPATGENLNELADGPSIELR
jgi:putative membrane protein